MAILHLCRGYPGQGKSVFGSTMFPDIPHFENDMFFMRDNKYCYDRRKMTEAIGWCLSQVENCLKLGIDCTVANTFTRKNFVESYKRLAEKYNAEFKVYRMMGNFQNVHNVPENILKNMKENFEDYDGETYVYPNLNQSKDDPCYRPYMFTDLKVGDRIELMVAVCDMMPMPPPQYATVTEIRQGTYDYLNIYYRKDDGSECLCMTGDCRKI